LYGLCSKDIAKALVSDLRVPCDESLLAFSVMAKLSDQLIKSALPFGAEMGKEELIRELLNGAVSSQSYCWYSVRVVHILMKFFKIDSLVLLLANSDFLRKQNFLCVFMVIRTFEWKLRLAQEKSGNQEFLAFCEGVHSKHSGIFDREWKTIAFSDLWSKKSIALALHQA
jgi:hypothetical protein